jgi:trans-2,3-dihydro-3-hydroxyanthranilate isomerase
MAEDIRTDRHQPQVFSVGTPFLTVELASREALRRATPSSRGYGNVLPLDGAQAIYCYIRPPAQSPSGYGTEVQARSFSPRLIEDPATASATAAAAAMLAETSPERHGELTFRFKQGVDMGRPSLLVARVVKKAGCASAAYVGGHCVAVMEGSMTLPTLG